MKEIVTLAGKKYEVADGIYNPIEKIIQREIITQK